MTNADLQYAALVCALMLAIAACTRAVILLPLEHAQVALEVAAFAQLAIGIVAGLMLVFRSLPTRSRK